MPCADEDFAVREFELEDTPDVYTGDKPDYVCLHCGWLQTSTLGGMNELLSLATWHSNEARLDFIKRGTAAVEAMNGLSTQDQ